MINVEFLKGQISKKSDSELKRCYNLYTELASKSVRDEVYRTLLENELARRESAGGCGFFTTDPAATRTRASR